MTSGSGVNEWMIRHDPEEEDARVHLDDYYNNNTVLRKDHRAYTRIYPKCWQEDQESLNQLIAALSR